MLGRSLGNIGAGSAVGARMDSLLGDDGAGEKLQHCSKIWHMLSMACSWVSKIVEGLSLMAYVQSFRACLILSSFVSDGCVRYECKNFTVYEITMDFVFLLSSKKHR